MAVSTRYEKVLLRIQVAILRARRGKRTSLGHAAGVGAYSSSKLALAA